MSKKKNEHIERNTLKKQEKQALHQRLENFIVKHTGIALVLAVLFTVFNNYKNSYELAGGMIVLFNILIWLGVATVLVFAILGTIKKDSGLYKWCAAGAANSVIWFVFYRFGRYRAFISGVSYCYYALVLYFLFCLAYYFLAYYGAWNKKAVRIIFYVIVAIAALLWVVSAVVFMYLSGAFTGYAI